MKRMTLWCLLAALSLTGFAQESVQDSVRVMIRKLKLSEQYLYAEAAAMGSAEDVKVLALEELNINIVDFLSNQGKSKEEVQALREEVAPNCRLLLYQRGTLWKSFAYVEKALLTGNEMEEAVSEPSVAEAPLTEQPAAAQPVAETAVAEKPVIEEFVVGTTAPEEVVADSVEITLIEPDQVEVVSVEVDTTMIDEKVEVPAVEMAEVKIPTVTTEEDDDEVMHRRVLNELFALQTYDNVMMYLTTMKEDGRLMYGRLSTLINPQDAYMIILKDGQLVTILGRGSGERQNLKTQQPDALKNYKGHAVIWLKIFN